MTNEIDIYGHSDDLIEITGAINEELYANYNEPTEFTIGEWRFKASYDGEWSFDVLEHPDGVMWEHLSVDEHADDVHGHNEYSELVRCSLGDLVEVEKVE